MSKQENIWWTTTHVKTSEEEKNYVFSSAISTSWGYHDSLLSVPASSPLHLLNEEGKTAPREGSLHTIMFLARFPAYKHSRHSRRRSSLLLYPTTVQPGPISTFQLPVEIILPPLTMTLLTQSSSGHTNMAYKNVLIKASTIKSLFFSTVKSCFSPETILPYQFLPISIPTIPNQILEPTNHFQIYLFVNTSFLKK